MSDEPEEMDDDEIDGEAVDEGSDEGAVRAASADILEEDDANMAVRNAMRKQIESDVEAFLARGGSISVIAPNVVSDPPRKPESNYGGQPI
ncbi:MAG: hypothetical protein RL497_2177 [Pseudomonadota bacterium]|jgi:hypothetical protein